MIELKERILALEHRIKKMEKGKKSMEVQQLHREKEMGKVIEDGESEYAQQITRIKAEYTIIDKKTKEVDDALERKSTTLHESNKRMATLKEDLKKHTDEATGQGINLDLDPALSAQAKGVSARFAELEAKKAAILKTVNLIKTRHSVTLGEYVAKKTAMQKQVSTIAESLQTRNEYTS